MSSKELIVEGKRVIEGNCLYYERNGECHALPYEPGVGFVSDPSLVEYGTGGPNFLVSRDAWCKARHGTANWQKKEVSAELVEAQKPCTRYQKGWPQTEDGLEIYDKDGEWVRDIDEDGNWITKEVE